jgi:hypothetical protein
LELPDSTWVGTHCWPGRLDLTQFNSIINVTTTTYKSKLYRWSRAHHHYYSKSDLNGQERVDKERETAKNYLIPFEPVVGINVTNIEFAEVVEKSKEFQNLAESRDVSHHLARWQNINKFLYETDIWNSVAFRRFYEAEFENQLGRYYVYQ